ncbi:glycosyltransferase family 2 protein [Mangrovicoccus algicola]|uniref:Glycosyltransferase family 2 protein n=1 Tax=Mangrovicoccus algicola TaxID=2771008 RepID=A0A8J7CW41_9RHOB|nr:glycosyltransferase family 2 protein [Mangrovicoccus algicola]MBE3639509.1 glycosyltransferase family 2 protein [Mangrovicoccus algicola]
METASVGVVIVAFNSGQEVVDCAASVMGAAAAAGLGLRVVVVDNASTDDTVARLADWAAGTALPCPAEALPFAIPPLAAPPGLAEGGPGMAPRPEAPLALIRTGANRGFAGGVNAGLAYLAQMPGIAHFWVLNPDSVVPPESLAALKARLETGAPYGLMGGRVTYLDPPDMIQIDGGGRVNRRTGVTVNCGLGASHAATPPARAQEMDFIMGANVIASRAFYEAVGPMREEYFLYYEEVDWAMRRGALPLDYCAGLRVYHLAGTAIGSPTLAKLASPFSLYFKHRGRMMFLRRFLPGARLTGYGYSLAYAARCLIRDRSPQAAAAVLRGAFGLNPPQAVRDRLGPEACRIAFGA